ncbi:hypothetical protein RCIP0078_00065 [Klebsiella phage RCIP0078]
MKHFIKNAVVAIVGTNFEGKKSRIHLLHVGNDGKMRGAFYYGERGEVLYDSKFLSRLVRFQPEKEFMELSPEYLCEGLVVESFVADPVKLTSRDYKRMARKAHKLMKRTPKSHVWHIFANQL